MSNAPSVFDPVRTRWIERFTIDLNALLTAVGRGRITSSSPGRVTFERHAISVTASETDPDRLTVNVEEVANIARGAARNVGNFPATAGDDTYVVARRVTAWLMPRIR